MTNRCYRR